MCKIKDVTTPQRLPEKYYRRRRIAALIILVVVVALLIWGISALARSGNDDQPVEETTTAVESPSSSSEPIAIDEEDEETDEEEPTFEKEEDEEEPEAEAKACEPNDLDVSVQADRTTYGPDARPVFHMIVANPGDQDCIVDLDEHILRFEVYDLGSNERLWSDVDCFEPVETGEQTFKAGDDRYFEAVWSKTGSAPGECENRPQMEPGGYFLHGVIGDNASESVTFNLR